MHVIPVLPEIPQQLHTVFVPSACGFSGHCARPSCFHFTVVAAVYSKLSATGALDVYVESVVYFSG